MRALLVALALSTAAFAQEPNTVPSFAFLKEPPLGLPPMPEPAGYSPTPAMFVLGQQLFHDAVLSSDRTISCASCHPSPGFASAEPRPAGVAGKRAVRHAPALWNRGYGTLQRWDGGSVTLDSFVLEPIEDPNEMALSLDSALGRLAEDERYRKDFQAVFGSPPNRVSLSRALATFVRGIVRGNAPYDHFLRGDREAMSPQERTGFWIFESKGRCWQCHTPGLFTDDSFHNTGIGVKDGEPERGRAQVTGNDADGGAFKTPTVRGVKLTAPYMHDGSLKTLNDVVEFYVRGGNHNPLLDSRLKPLKLSATEQDALVAFLRSL